MRILQITPRLPFPLTDGGAIGIYNILKGNAERGHEITLVSFAADTAEETESALAELSKFAKIVITRSPLPSRLTALARSAFRGAYPIERRMMPEMFEMLRTLCAERSFDVVHVDHSHMGRYGLWLKQEFGLPILLRQHNFESMIYERFADTQKNPALSSLARLHGKRLREEEIKFMNAFDTVAAISREDKEAMQRCAPSGNISVIPAGMPVPPRTNAFPVPGRILAIGGTDWEPNIDGFKFLIRDIFPRIREAHPPAELHIVGKGTEALSNRAKGIVGHGRVPIIEDHIRNAEVAVIPLRIGGGMRVKLVELFSHSKAVVSTTIGAEGNLAADGREILLRDTADSFAQAVIQLLLEPELRKRLEQNGRELMVREYSLEHLAELFENEYTQAVHRSALSNVVAV